MASQKVFGSYQEIIDLHTEANHVSAIGIHTPTGDTPRKMFKGYFDQYKKYKYLGASITLVPAARLPADPMGVSYNSTGQVEGTAMDPRDALNPIMFHGCHGDDMGAILNTLYGNNSSISDSVDGLDGGAVSITDFVGASLWINMERLYYKALTDKTWKKANPMSGFKKGNLRPLVYSLATNRQIMPYDGSPAGIGAFTQGGDPTTQIVEDEDSELWSPTRANNLQFFTPRLTRLGWMETRNVHATQRSGIEGIESADDIPEFIAQALDTTTTPAEMPKIYMGIILMAPAYGVEQYYRMIVNHRFAFKEFRGISFMPTTDGVPSYVNANPDLFNGDTYDDWDSAEGGEVDPPEPDPPVSGANVLLELTESGTIQVDGDIWDQYTIINAEDNLDHVVTVANVTPTSKGFIVKQSDRLNQVSNPIVGYHAYISPAIAATLDDGSGLPTPGTVNNIYLVNGKLFAYDTSSGMVECNAIYVNNQAVSFGVDPAFAELSDVVGTTTPLEDVSYGS